MLFSHPSKSVISSATTAMAAVILLFPVHSQPSHETKTRDGYELSPLIRPAQDMNPTVVERTGGTIEYQPSIWQPRIKESDFDQIKSVKTIETVSYSNDVREILETSGWTLEELGNVVGVSRQSVHNWLTDKPVSKRNQQAITQVRDVIERASIAAGRDDVQHWLITPSAQDGRTPTNLLSDGKYDIARLRAMLSPSSVIRIPNLVDSTQNSPWSHLLEG